MLQPLALAYSPLPLLHPLTLATAPYPCYRPLLHLHPCRCLPPLPPPSSPGAPAARPRHLAAARSDLRLLLRPIPGGDRLCSRRGRRDAQGRQDPLRCERDGVRSRRGAASPHLASSRPISPDLACVRGRSDPPPPPPPPPAPRGSTQVGTLSPGGQQPTSQLRAGEVGYMHGAIKQAATSPDLATSPTISHDLARAHAASTARSRTDPHPRGR